MAKGLGWLSQQGESGGSGPGTISDGNGDSGGISYGIYQFSSDSGVVQQFVDFLRNLAAPYDEYGDQLAAFEINSEDFQAKWIELATNDNEGFSMLQDSFSKPKYFDSGATNLWEKYGIDIHQHSFALKSVLFSNCIQHGDTYGAEVFKDAADMVGIDITEMTDQQFIGNIYEVKLTDMSWSSGAPEQRPGLFDRWRRERAIALNMLSSNEQGEE